MDGWDSYESPGSRIRSSSADNTTPKDIMAANLGLGNGDLVSNLLRGLGAAAGAR